MIKMVDVVVIFRYPVFLPFKIFPLSCQVETFNYEILLVCNETQCTLSFSILFYFSFFSLLCVFVCVNCVYAFHYLFFFNISLMNRRLSHLFYLLFIFFSPFFLLTCVIFAYFCVYCLYHLIFYYFFQFFFSIHREKKEPTSTGNG